MARFSSRRRVSELRERHRQVLARERQSDFGGLLAVPFDLGSGAPGDSLPNTLTVPASLLLGLSYNAATARGDLVVIADSQTFTLQALGGAETPASNYMTLNGTPLAGDTFDVAGVQYVFVDALSLVPTLNEVLIDVDDETTATNATLAIKSGDSDPVSSGSIYSANIVANPGVKVTDSTFVNLFVFEHPLVVRPAVRVFALDGLGYEGNYTIVSSSTDRLRWGDGTHKYPDTNLIGGLNPPPSRRLLGYVEEGDVVEVRSAASLPAGAVALYLVDDWRSFRAIATGSFS